MTIVNGRDCVQPLLVATLPGSADFCQRAHSVVRSDVCTSSASQRSSADVLTYEEMRRPAVRIEEHLRPLAPPERYIPRRQRRQGGGARARRRSALAFVAAPAAGGDVVLVGRAARAGVEQPLTIGRAQDLPSPGNPW